MNKLFRLFPLALVVFIVIFSINRAPERPSNVQIPNVSSKLKLANSYGNGSLDNLQIGDDGLVYTLGSKGLMRFDRDMKNGVVLIDEAATDISLKKDGLVIRGNLLAVVLINGLTLFDTERNKIIWSEKNYKAEHIAISPSGNHIFSSKLTKRLFAKGIKWD